MHTIFVSTLFVLGLVLLLTGYVERRRSVLSLVTPLVTIWWLASTVSLDSGVTQGGGPRVLLSLYVLPLLLMVGPTIFVLFGPAMRYFEDRNWRFAVVYRWIVLITLVILLARMVASPWIAN